jgi:hypothetical protein
MVLDRVILIVASSKSISDHLRGKASIPTRRPVSTNRRMSVRRRNSQCVRILFSSVNEMERGATSEPVFSAPVEIQVERDDLPLALRVPSLRAFNSAGSPLPLPVEAQFADGSQLDVTHSIKTTFESRNPAIAIVDEQRRLVALGPGETTVLIGYAGQLYTTVVVDGPGTALGGKSLLSYHGVEHTDADSGTELHGMTEQGSFAAHPRFSIDAVLGAVMPGKQIRIVGSGFTPEQETGFVTVAGVTAEVVTWTTRDHRNCSAVHHADENDYNLGPSG